MFYWSEVRDMVEVSHLQERSCENCDRMNRESDTGPPYYKVPFIFGAEPRMAMEWHCGDCIEEDPAFTTKDQELLLAGVEVEEVEERYLSGENPDDFLNWEDVQT